jgi:argininosuccinate synthase
MAAKPPPIRFAPDTTVQPTASYVADPAEVHRVLLLYSGGLDTSVMLKWIQDQYVAEVVALTVNLGQPGEDYDVIRGKALQIGAVEAHVVDAREEFTRGYVCPAIKANAIYGAGYPLFTALGRPLIAKLAVEYARQTGCDTIAHGCTGKGNDQVRIESTIATLAPELKVIAPVRQWRMGRDEEVRYAREHGIPVKGGSEIAPYSIDDNLWGRSSEGRWIEDLAHAPEADVFQLVTRPEEAPDEPETVTIDFERGEPVALDSERRRSGRATGWESSTRSRTGSSGSRSVTSTRSQPRRSSCSLTRSSNAWSERSTRTSSSRFSTSAGLTSSTLGCGGSRCARISTPTCRRPTSR